MSREGAILFEFAPVGNGPRDYDWGKKSYFSLSANECGEVLAMNPSVGKEFLHDPNLGTAEAGKLTKRMKWSITQDSKGYE